VLPLLVLLAGACSPEHYPQTSLRPLSDFAKIGDDIQTTTFYWAFGVFVLVEGALLYSIFRFRGKPGDAEPKQVHGNTTVEIIWTVIPALILAAIAVPTVRGIFQTNEVPTGDVLRVQVVGHQWWWEFRYPDLHLTTANEIHIPVGQTVSLHMGTADVVHSFWPPRFAGKRDVFPNRETRLWFQAKVAGEYPGQCAEFCGIQHGRMAFRVKAQTPEEFQAWVAHMQTLRPKPAAAASVPSDSVRTASAGAIAQAQGKAPAKAPADSTAAPAAPQDPAYAAGEKLFTAKGCVGCHSLVAVDAPQGMIGPNLANVGARSYIGAGSFKNTDETLARWIQNPQAMKQGVLMPNLGVKPDEAKLLVAFLRAHQ
jgi:cytochrome c oxidase subunit 2